ncbi:MAG: hypothetical protein VB997_08075, partial [Opitutales bacterium]
VPWCLNGKIHSKNDKGDKIEIIADLTIGKNFFNETYKSFVKDQISGFGLGERQSPNDETREGEEFARRSGGA